LEEETKAAMCWLPSWEDCRDILKKLAIPWDQIENRALTDRQGEVSLVGNGL